ncbi:MAG: hypothetical protein QG635_403, partial [Bacteroidota bacterium]|nr:hypothetical protein [Bacteroidota bacterium]
MKYFAFFFVLMIILASCENKESLTM